MSENFEKVILEKLDNLEKGQNEQQKFNKNVLEKLDNLEKGQERLEANQERLEERQGRLEANQERLEERQGKLEANQERLEERQGKLETKQENFEMTQQEFNTRIIELYKELKDEATNTKNELTRFSNHFTAFEYEINRKVDLLLENYDFYHKQFVKNNADIFDLQEKYNKHDDIIKVLQLKAAMP